MTVLMFWNSQEFRVAVEEEANNRAKFGKE